MPFFIPVAVASAGVWAWNKLDEVIKEDERNQRVAKASEALAAQKALNKAKKEALYRKYALSPSDIRLLVLEPGTGPIKCRFEVKALSKSGDYEAISYIWGANPGKSIYINEVEFEVSETLWSALWQFRQDATGKERRMWADAVCINQDQSLPEKNHQIRNMHLIFGAARDVRIWLGKSTPESKITIEAFDSLVASAKDFTDEELVKTYHESPEIWDSFRASFLENVWWTRAWIIQEVILAKKPMMHIGEGAEHFDNVATICAAMARTAMVPNSEDQGRIDLIKSETRHEIALCRARQLQGLRITFTEWVAKFHTQDCHDPRDLLYGFLGLADEELRSQLIPRYGAPLESIYRDGTQQIIERWKSLDFICIGRGIGSIERGLPEKTQRDEKLLELPVELPTWVPDLRVADGHGLWFQRSLPVNLSAQTEVVHQSVSDTNVFNASGKPFKGSWTSNGTKMICNGVEICKILDASRPNISNGDCAQEFLLGSITQQFVNEAKRMVAKIVAAVPKSKWSLKSGPVRYPGKSSESYEKALNKTLMLNLRADGSRLEGEEDSDSINETPPEWWMASETFFVTESARELRQQAWIAHHQAKRYAWSSGKRFIVSENNYIGMANVDCRQGDVISILDGATVPFVLRNSGNGDWIFVGECYLHGFMDGECQKLQLREKEFILC